MQSSQANTDRCYIHFNTEKTRRELVVEGNSANLLKADFANPLELLTKRLSRIHVVPIQDGTNVRIVILQRPLLHEPLDVLKDNSRFLNDSFSIIPSKIAKKRHSFLLCSHNCGLLLTNFNLADKEKATGESSNFSPDSIGIPQQFVKVQVLQSRIKKCKKIKK